MSKEGRELETVMILMTAIIGRLFHKHHRFVYCITRKLGWGGVLFGLELYCPPSPDTSEESQT